MSYDQIGIYQFSIFQLMEKQFVPIATPLNVHPELLRKREIKGPYLLDKKSKCDESNIKTNISVNLCSPCQTPDTSTNPEPSHCKRRVNWLRYNIIVGIYQNWIRLYPYIIHLLRRSPQDHQRDTQSRQKFAFLIKKVSSKTSGLQEQNQLDQKEIASLMQALKARQGQLLQQAKHLNFDQDQADNDIIKIVNRLAKQLLSTLPIQNSKWSKTRIERHNRLLDEVISSFSAEQFAVSSDVVIQSLKERLQFINKIQTMFIDSCKQGQNILKEKLYLLKNPLKKAGLIKNQEKYESSLQYLWNQLKNKRSPVKTTAKVQRISRYTVQDSASNSLTIKYQSKKSDYFNDAYIRNKQKANGKLRKKKYHRQKHQISQSSHANEADTMPASILVGEDVSNSSRSGSKQEGSQPYDNKLEKYHLQRVESFMIRQKIKGGKQNQGSFFSRQKNIKRQQAHRSSFIFPDMSRPPRQSVPRSSISSHMSFIQKRQPFQRRNPSRLSPSIQRIDQQEKQEHHLSRFKSHKKIGTMKHINANNRRIRITKQNIKKPDRGRDSNVKMANFENKLGKKQLRKQYFDSRRGNLLKKGVYRRPMQSEQTGDDLINQEGGNYLSKKQQILSYFTMIKAKGLLEEPKYQQLKNKVEYFLQQQSPSVIAANRQFAQMIQQKSLHCDFIRLPDGLRMQEPSRFLRDLRGIISNDERVQIKIKEEMKIFFDDQFINCPSQMSVGNEQYVFNTVQMNNIQEQLKRGLKFQTDGQCISFANSLARVSNKLEQKMLK